jgi:hypothetical protein
LVSLKAASHVFKAWDSKPPRTSEIFNRSALAFAFCGCSGTSEVI